MGSGSGVWDIADIISASRMNRKTLIADTGTNLNGLATTFGGQLAFCTTTGSGFTAEQLYQRNSSNTAWIAITSAGKQDLYWGSPAWWARATSGAGGLTRTELATNKINLQTFDFDTTSQEFIQTIIAFPRNWDRGTIKFTPHWTAASGSGGVVFALQGYAFSNDDALDTALGTEQTSTDTLITANDEHLGPQSAAITIGGTPADEDLVVLQLKRNVADASDILGVDALLLGITIELSLDSSIAA